MNPLHTLRMCFLSLSIMLLSGIMVPGFCQLNLSVGYQAGFPQPNGYNTLLDLHNADREDYHENFKTLKFLHGLEFGLRYKVNQTGFAFGYQYSPKKLTASGADFSNTIQNTFHIVKFELQQYIDFIVLSASIDHNTLSVNQSFELPDYGDKFTSNAWSSHFSAGYQHAGDNNFGWAARPFVKIYWTDHDLAALREGLNVPQGPGDTDFMQFGIQIILYNGPQGGG